ncbi:MAG TPA: hypothetical protein ENK55_10265 [Actinobacteria bacterium]|nr:hypothetical protein [Actinomycetota bacterium]
MSLVGWTLPLTPTGRSQLVPPPPWRYSGEIIGVDFRADPDRVAAYLPEGLEPVGDGSASFVFADWCSAADVDPLVRDDPARGQYKEAYLVLHARLGGRRAGRVPFIWVDSDLSLVRGLVQGFPKKLGDIAMTRPVELGVGGYRKEPGARFTGHVTALGRRVVTARVELAEVRDGWYPPGIATPLVHTRLWPAIDRDEPAVAELSRAKIEGFELGEVLVGPATLEFGESEFDEIADLAPIEVGEGYVCSVAFGVVGGEVVEIEEEA